MRLLHQFFCKPFYMNVSEVTPGDRVAYEATGLPHQSSDLLVGVELLRETGCFVLEVGSDLLLCEILLALMPLDVLVDLCDTRRRVLFSILSQFWLCGFLKLAHA
jgi:hypothetical protein